MASPTQTARDFGSLIGSSASLRVADAPATAAAQIVGTGSTQLIDTAPAPCGQWGGIAGSPASNKKTRPWMAAL
jgi:hypothetical protein